MRRIALALLFLQLTAESGMTFNGAWSTPWHYVSALVDGQWTRVPLIDVGIVVLLGIVAASRGAWKGVAPPMIHALLVAGGAVAAWLVWGVLRGGWAHAAIYQVHGWVFCVLYALLLLAVLRTPAALASVGKTIVAAALFRAFFGLCFYRFVARTLPEYPPYMTQHDDSVLFVMAIIVTLCWAIERRSRRAVLTTAFVTLAMIAMIHVNNRRLAWASLGGAGLVVYLLLPPSAVRRRINLVVLALALYAAVGWGRPERVFLPLRSLQTMNDSQTDLSAKARRNENISLVALMRENPIVGTGWGKEFHELDTSLSVHGDLATLYHYIPHNGVLALLAFTGLLGFVLHWSPFPVSAFLNARARAAARTPIDRAASMAALAQIVVCGNQIYGDMGQYSMQTLLMAATGFAVAGRLAVSTGAWPQHGIKAPARRG